MDVIFVYLYPRNVQTVEKNLCDIKIFHILYNVHFEHIAHLRQLCHNSKCVIFQERLLMVLKCYNFLCVQRWHNCSLAASFANCIMKIYLLKVHLQTFLSIPITQKCQIWSCDTLVANERHIVAYHGIATCSLSIILILRCVRVLWATSSSIYMEMSQSQEVWSQSVQTYNIYSTRR
jgi:hypothetical protein